MPRKLSDYRSENPKNYSLFNDPSAANLVAAFPLNKQYGLRDISYQIRGGGTEFTNYSYVKINTSNIVSHQSCFYDSSLRIPYVARNQAGGATVIDVGVSAPGLAVPPSTGDLGTGDWTVECWMYFESFDFEEFSIMHPFKYNDGSDNGDTPSLVIFGDNKASLRRRVSLRYSTAVGTWADYPQTSTSPGGTTSSLYSGQLSPRVWYYIAAHKRTNNSYAISIGSRESEGSVSVDGITNCGSTTTTYFTAAVSTPHDFQGINYQFLYGKFVNGRMPVGVYCQDLKFYNISKSTAGSEYRVPDPMLVY